MATIFSRSRLVLPAACLALVFAIGVTVSPRSPAQSPAQSSTINFTVPDNP